MTPDERQRLELLETIVLSLIRSDRLFVEKHLQLLDARNIQLGKSVGTKIGTESTQKLGFYGATPVARQASVTDADGTLSGATSTINTVIDRLQAYGLLP